MFKAPISGIVTALNVEVGENVETGTMNNPGTVILTLSELDVMQVEVQADAQNEFEVTLKKKTGREQPSLDDLDD